MKRLLSLLKFAILAMMFVVVATNPVAGYQSSLAQNPPVILLPPVK
ncbi:MAG: hypothetical protein PHS59_15365 [Paludibacter sp.]|nr:hypothetical protein [Paludibacter sp.]